MCKKEFIKLLARRFPELTEAQVSVMANRILATIIGAMQDGRRVEIRGFGTFIISKRKARLLDNPRTKAPVELPQRRIPRFRPSKRLSELADSPPPPPASSSSSSRR